MSKMSQLHAELTEQASELGFESLEQALANGYEVDYDNYKLAKHKLGYSETVEYLAKEQGKAHEAWLKEQEHALNVLDVVHDVLIEINAGLAKTGDIDLVEAWSLTELAKEIEGVEKFVKEAHD